MTAAIVAHGRLDQRIDLELDEIKRELSWTDFLSPNLALKTCSNTFACLEQHNMQTSSVNKAAPKSKVNDPKKLLCLSTVTSVCRPSLRSMSGIVAIDQKGSEHVMK